MASRMVGRRLVRDDDGLATSLPSKGKMAGVMIGVFVANIVIWGGLIVLAAVALKWALS